MVSDDIRYIFVATFSFTVVLSGSYARFILFPVTSLFIIFVAFACLVFIHYAGTESLYFIVFVHLIKISSGSSKNIFYKWMFIDL